MQQALMQTSGDDPILPIGPIRCIDLDIGVDRKLDETFCNCGSNLAMLDAVMRDQDPQYELVTLQVDGSSFIVPMRQGMIGASHRLTIAAGDVSLARVAPTG